MEVTRRARLLRVAVQATFVIDDGATLEEFQGPVVTVPGSRWAEFADRAFGDADLESVLARFDESQSPDPTEEKPK